MKELIDALWESKWLAAQNETWGHLKAKPGAHKGYMLFTCTEYGITLPIVSDFGVGGSPWFYQAQHDFVYAQNTEEGEIYLFVGYYTMPATKDSVGYFDGKVERLDLKQLLTPCISS